jgi:hypothetical protein
MSAGTLRVVADGAAASAKLPICFAPPDTGLALTESAQQKRVVATCASAAEAQGVSVVPIAAGGCLVATLKWAASDTASREADCSRTFAGGAECELAAVFQKTLRVSLVDQGSNRVVIESTAALHSQFDAFTDKSFAALCSAAFSNYPNPLQGETLQVPSE